MRWPFEPHKVDDKFGVPRWYGLHSGVDLNGPQGGNTDCGWSLFPITHCELWHTSKANTGYGNIVIYKILGEWGERWIRYCHCRDIPTNKREQWQIDVPIALIGSTGNSTYCHLHWDIIKKPMTNWRAYARTKEILDEYFEDPLLFMSRWQNSEGENMEDLKKELEHLKKEYADEQQRLIDCRKDREKLGGEIKRLETQVEELDNQYHTFVRSVALKLGSTQNEAQILAAVETIINEFKETKNSLETCESKALKHIKLASGIVGSPLSSLEAVLGALESLKSKEKPVVIIEKPFIQKFIDWLNKILRK